MDRSDDLGEGGRTVVQLIHAAVERGAKLLCGGQRSGAMLEATLLEGVPTDCDAMAKEAFGPLACLSSFTDFDEALRQVNDSVFGLEPGSSPATSTRSRRPGTSWTLAAW